MDDPVQGFEAKLENHKHTYSKFFDSNTFIDQLDFSVIF